MGSAQHEAGAAHGRHADEVVRAAREGRERRGERAPADRLQPDRGRDHLLLGDVHLEEAVGVRLREGVRERRVRDLPVEDDDVPSGRAQRGQRVAVCLPGRDLAPDLVARELELAGLEAVCLARLGLRHLDPEVSQAAELRDRILGVVERLAVEPVHVLDRLHALALDRPGDDHRRLARRRERLAYARSIASTSWPSIGIACQPKACARST